MRDRSITVDAHSIKPEQETCEGRKMLEQEARYLVLLPKLTQYGVYGDTLHANQ